MVSISLVPVWLQLYTGSSCHMLAMPHHNPYMSVQLGRVCQHILYSVGVANCPDTDHWVETPNPLLKGLDLLHFLIFILYIALYISIYPAISSLALPAQVPRAKLAELALVHICANLKNVQWPSMPCCVHVMNCLGYVFKHDPFLMQLPWGLKSMPHDPPMCRIGL